MGAQIALINPKYSRNVSAVIRAASAFNVEDVMFTGERVMTAEGEIITEWRGGSKKPRLPREERMKGYSKVNWRRTDRPFDGLPPGTVPVAVDLVPGAESLIEFEHPDNALYVFGPEDGSLHRTNLSLCHRRVFIPMAHCANLAAAVYMTLYDRHAKRVRAGVEPEIVLAESRGFIDLEEVG